MGMKCLICRIPSSVPQGRGDCVIRPSPTESSVREPWGWVPRFPVTIGNPVIHNAWLDPLNSECHWWSENVQENIWGLFWLFFFFFCCLWNRLKSGWSSMAALHRKGKKKILGWTLGLLPETVGIIFVSKSCLCNDAPPCHYSLLGCGAGD